MARDRVLWQAIMIMIIGFRVLLKAWNFPTNFVMHYVYKYTKGDKIQIGKMSKLKSPKILLVAQNQVTLLTPRHCKHQRVTQHNSKHESPRADPGPTTCHFTLTFARLAPSTGERQLYCKNISQLRGPFVEWNDGEGLSQADNCSAVARAVQRQGR